MKYVQASSDWWASQGVQVGKVEIQPAYADIICAGDEFKDDAIFCHHKLGGGTLKYKPARFSQMKADGGELSIELTVAHEMGHAVQYAQSAKHSNKDRWELSADCFAGAYVATTGVSADDARSALNSTQLVNIAGAPDAVQYGGGEIAGGVFGKQLVDFCLTYKP